MLRQFLPVGQGAFYRESFSCGDAEAVHVVYDCGSSTDIGLLKRCIRRCFERGQSIQAVFLSHFHEDHVNGLEYLLKHCRVEHIFFPLLIGEDKELTLLQHLTSSALAKENDFWVRFARDPRAALDRLDLDYRPRLHPVRPVDDGDEENTPYSAADDFLRPIIIDSGRDVSDIIFGHIADTYRDQAIEHWRYIPCHFREKDRREKLKEVLKSRLGTGNPKKLLDMLKANPLYRSDIRKAYKEVRGDLNTNSMTLFSGTKHPHFWQGMRGWQCPFERFMDAPQVCGCADYLLKPGALYMGDYDAKGPWKWEALQKAYQEYFPYIGCLQLPHHGSRHSFNLELLGIKSCDLYIASAGLDNPFRHPHGDVVKRVLLSGTQPLIVTEQSDSMVELSVAPLAYPLCRKS